MLTVVCCLWLGHAAEGCYSGVDPSVRAQSAGHGRTLSLRRTKQELGERRGKVVMDTV